MSSNYVTQKLAVELLSPYLDNLVNETKHDSKYWPIQKISTFSDETGQALCSLDQSILVIIFPFG